MCNYLTQDDGEQSIISPCNNGPILLPAEHSLAAATTKGI